MNTDKFSQISNKSSKKSSASSLKLISKVLGITFAILFFYSNSHNERIDENGIRNVRHLAEYIPNISNPTGNVYHFSRNEYNQEREENRNNYSSWTSGEVPNNGQYSEYRISSEISENIKTHAKNFINLLKTYYHYWIPMAIGYYLALKNFGTDCTLLITVIMGVLYYIHINSS
ncbi:Plasmodium exported protein, unknown function [Plasmodium berghei]|uniref:Uncharacterized protein n=2 Tax=Plasmodium berghei TaxID=5821 RepID=A0A509AR47_PLABA|nr:Plasmodium exported protein, unknown function [Plasmodium berghei ANKA]CXJ09502.1 Plasmodium exported protein, unknown function [Plasmodium berghei]SCM25902.1 Plasmodium exported protein, unknown function [Plasmodium berghei]SCN28172.1 Plasmodium exported protein, unknown function [Plasmodium berghei]SCO62375.1 Plasmodium exported protein, unknown function [Plasmodium berghei]SCO63933.1 Plasmodium exported protein, unknown function [Plasmodium berghei]|eukprot:XP_034423829.1 Plasmodium exported protein, unknown function [Plasmodium berghei ANKA]